MNRSEFALVLRESLDGEIKKFSTQTPGEHPYALAIIGGQTGNYIGLAIATEEGLQRCAATYDRAGYRFDGREWEEFDNIEKLSTWMRWANPDEGWQYLDFERSDEFCKSLRELFEEGALSDDGSLEAFCTDEVLAPLWETPRWKEDEVAAALIVGFTYGESPQDFLRSATRANPYASVQKLWAEVFAAEEIGRRIKRSKSG